MAEDDALRMLTDAAAAFVRSEGRVVRDMRAEPGGYDRALWRGMGGQGWLSILVPEASGGLGLDASAAAIVAERLGYAGWPLPFIASGVMVPYCLGRSDNAALRARVLDAVTAGECVSCAAWQNADGGVDAVATPLNAQAAGDGVTIRGAAHFVANATADAFLVAAREQSGVSLWWVPRDQPGLTVHAAPLADGTSGARVGLDAVTLPGEARVAPPSAGAALLEDAIDHAAALSAAELMGNMERALELTLEYLRTRKQFGKPVGSFQALQHRAVDLWIAKELSRAALNAALSRLCDATSAPEARASAASGARARAAQSAFLICNQAIQLHGAIGFTDEYDLGLLVNRALVLCAWPGDARAHRQRYARTGGAS